MSTQPSRALLKRLAKSRLSSEDVARGGRVSTLHDEESLRLLQAIQQHGTEGPSLAGDSTLLGNRGIARTLARVLGNRRFGELAAPESQMQSDVGSKDAGNRNLSGDDPGYVLSVNPTTEILRRSSGIVADLGIAQSGDVIQREAQATSLSVSLTFTESAMRPYRVAGATMEDVCQALPSNIGRFHHSAAATWQTRTESETGTRVTSVNLPVTYYYVMPEWTHLSSQSEAVQAAWNRFYNDLFAHEREHYTVSQRYYNALRAALERLPEEERTVARVQQEIQDSVAAQNETHTSHTGFTTSSTYICRDYIP